MEGFRLNQPETLHSLRVDLTQRQDGAVARGQLVAAGLSDNDIEVLIRRRVLAGAARGVYVVCGSVPPWSRRVWVATLRYAPAAATGRTCLALAGLVPPPETAEVVVAAGRRIGGEAGIRVRRSRAFDDVAMLGRHPPQVRLEHAVLEVAATLKDETSLVALITDAVRSRRTTPARLAAELAARPRFPARGLVASLLEDAGAGVQSVLEQRYRREVEIAHGLPQGRRQVRDDVAGRTIYRDVDYLGGLLVVELDGRLGHEASRDRWADAERDLVTLARGGRTLRVTFGQVLEPCRLAALVADALVSLGWRGTPVPCSQDCSFELGSWRVSG